MLRAIVRPIIIAAVVVIALGTLEQRVLKPTGVIDWLLPTPAIPQGAGAAAVPTTPQLNASSYDYILSTLAQIAGVFIGLYFTAVNLVASTIYARVPNDVRALVVSEKLGNQYVKIVAFLGATTTLLLAGNVLGFPPTVLNLTLITFAGLVSIYSFLVLGKRVFHFFDPTRLTHQLFMQLIDCVRAATPDGFRWHDPSFQSRAQRQAQTLLTTYRRLVDLACSNDHRHIEAESLVAIGGNTLLLLRYYGQEKLRIPTESFWFRRNVEEHNWLVADSTRVDMALTSSTAIQPKLVPDAMWFEREVEAILLAIYGELLRRDELESAVSLLNQAQDTAGYFAESLSIDEAIGLLEALRQVVRSLATINPPGRDKAARDTQRPRLVLAHWDAMGIGVVNLLLGFSRRLEILTIAGFEAGVALIQWRRSSAIYGTGLPRKAVEQLESLQRGLSFERKAEGRTVTPVWFCVQLAHLGFIQAIAASLAAVTALFETVFGADVQPLIDADQPLLAATLIQRGLEACHKFTGHLGQIKERIDGLTPLRRVPDITYPEIAWDNLLSRVDAVRRRLLVQFGTVALRLARQPADKTVPDYFGQACLVLANACHGAIVAANQELIGDLFPLFFRCSFVAHDRLRELLKDRNDMSKIVFSTEPIVDLMNLSGYAVVYSELNNLQISQIVQDQWNEYFRGFEDSRQVMKTINAILRFRERPMIGGPRILLRTKWQIELQKELNARGFTGRHFFHRLTGEPMPNHDSPIVRALSDAEMLMEDGEDIFAVVYLAQRPEGDELELTMKAREYKRRLNREQHAVEETEDDEGDD